MHTSAKGMIVNTGLTGLAFISKVYMQDVLPTMRLVGKGVCVCMYVCMHAHAGLSGFPLHSKIA